MLQVVSACILYSVVYKYAFGGNLVSWFPLKCFLHTISAREDLRRAEALTTECWCRKLSVRAPDHLGCFLVCFPCCSCQSPASRRCPLLSLPFLHWPFFPLDTRILFEHLSPLGRQKQLSMTLLVECLPLPCSPLVMGQVHRSNASITSRVNVQLLEVTSLPDLHHTIVPSRHQVLAIAAQENGLQKKHRKPTFLSKSVVTAKKHSVYSVISISSC